MTVYFIQDSVTCHIKIGHTDGDPLDRLKALQTGNPSKLVLLFSMPGDQEKEKQIQGFFSKAKKEENGFALFLTS